MRQVDQRNDEPSSRPLTEPAFLILTSLAQQPRHGYGLLQDIQHISDGRVSLSTGTLYGALRRLLEDGWIKPFQQEDTSREKQAYQLTAMGRKHLVSEMNRMRHLTRAAAARLRSNEG